MNFSKGKSALTGIFLLIALLLTATAVQAESDKYRLSWTDDPATTATLGWCQVSGDAVGIKYGKDPSLADGAAVNDVTALTYDNTLHPEGAPLVSYFVTLTGLAPDTAYYFSVIDSEGESEIMWFKTAPNSPKQLTFIAGGDSRTHREPRQWGNRLVAKLRPLFVAFGGDYHDDCTNDEMREWLDDWQLTMSSDNRIYPIIPAHGNHENDMTDFVALIFDMPNPDAYCASSVGGSMMRLYSLNTELEPGVGYGAFTDQTDEKWNDQAAWLAADMAANPDFTWKVGQFHRPMRPHTAEKPEGLGRIEAWAQTMYDNGMDLIVDCDSHMVKYTYPVAPSEDAGSFESFVRDDADGIMFIGEGSWGAPHRPVDDDKPWTLSSASFWQFKLIQASADALHIRTVKFGEYDETGAPSLGYSLDDIAELSQAEQDADPFAMPAGLDSILWKPLAGEVVSLPFTGADVDNTEYVSAGAEWKYLDDGSDQGTDWVAPGFNDAAWASGNAQLGYGDGDETTVVGFGPDENEKFITTYFRRTFQVADITDVIKLRLMLLRDDGAVVYINGAEAARSSMADGEVAYTTVANDAGDENKYFEYNLDPALLVDGTNTIAVEVHQSGGTSSDMSFDLVLYGIESRVDGAIPAAPTDLADTDVATSTIDLNWTDNATDEVGYELWRKVGDGSWEIFEPVLSPDTNAYGDSMLSEGTQYTYKVRAYSQNGLSAFSDELVVTTLAASTPLVWGEDFDSGSFGQFTTVSVTSSAVWEIYEYPAGSGEWFARINGYGADTASDDWLISPAFNLKGYRNEYVQADLAYNYDGPELEVLVSDNYDASVHANPADAHWTALSAAMPSVGNYAFETTGELGTRPCLRQFRRQHLRNVRQLQCCQQRGLGRRGAGRQARRRRKRFRGRRSQRRLADLPGHGGRRGRGDRDRFQPVPQVRRSRAASHGLRGLRRDRRYHCRDLDIIHHIPRRHQRRLEVGVALLYGKPGRPHVRGVPLRNDWDRIGRRRSTGRGRRGRPADNGHSGLPLRFHRYRRRRRPRLGSGQFRIQGRTRHFRFRRLQRGYHFRYLLYVDQRGEHRRLGDRGARGAEGRHRQRIRRRRSQRRLAGVPGGRPASRRVRGTGVRPLQKIRRTGIAGHRSPRTTTAAGTPLPPPGTPNRSEIRLDPPNMLKSFNIFAISFHIV